MTTSSCEPYIAAIERDFPRVREFECRLVHGQFNDVLIVGTEFVARFSRTAGDSARIARLLGRLDVGVETPRPLLRRDGFLALSYVPGEFWNTDREPPIDDFVALLARMSTVDCLPDLADAPNWPVFAAEVREFLYPLMSSAGRGRADRELDALLGLAGPAQTLVHGDLGGGNLRFVEGRLVGVIDWDEAHLGDPAADLASIAVTVGWDAAAGIAPDLLPAARAYAGTFALQQALPAFHTDDEENLDDGLVRYRE